MRNPQLLYVQGRRCSLHPPVTCVPQQVRRLRLLEAILGRSIAPSTRSCEVSRSTRLYSGTKRRYSQRLPPHDSRCCIVPSHAANRRAHTSIVQRKRSMHDHAIQEDDTKDLIPPQSPEVKVEFEKSSNSRDTLEQPKSSYTDSERTKTTKDSFYRGIIKVQRETAGTIREKVRSFLLDENFEVISFFSEDAKLFELMELTAKASGMTLELHSDERYAKIRKNNIDTIHLSSLVDDVWTEENLSFLQSSPMLAAERERDRMYGIFADCWKLWESACSGIAAAMPSVNVTEVDPAGSEEEVPGESVLRVQLLNNDFDIHLYQDFTDAESWEHGFPELAAEYSKKLATKLEHKSSTLLHLSKLEPRHFLFQAWSKLDKGAPKLEYSLVENLTASKPFDIWRCQLHSTKTGPVGQPQMWFHKKGARSLAFCAAAQEAYQEVMTSLHRGALSQDEARSVLSLVAGAENLAGDLPSSETSQVKPLEPFDLEIDSLTLRTMVNTLQQARALGLPDLVDRGTVPEQSTPHLPQIRERSLSRDLESGRLCCEQHLQRVKHGLRKDALSPRHALPIMQPNAVTQIIEAVNANDVVMISSTAGSGKSTQVPQIILDDYIHAGKGTECNILCTQPNRIAATSVARHVAYERLRPLGTSVGYYVPFDDQSPKFAGSINYVTTGLALKLLQTNHVDFLSQYSHIILDEVHVRDLSTDILLTRLRDFLAGRKSHNIRCPKIILMSATIDTSFFKRYFDDAHSDVPLQSTSLHVSDSRFDVHTHSLKCTVAEVSNSPWEMVSSTLDHESTQVHLRHQGIIVPKLATDHKITNDPEHPISSERDVYEAKIGHDKKFVPIVLVAGVLRHICSTTPSGDILVFLPGLTEIEKLYLLLSADVPESYKSIEFRLFQLHPSMYQTNDDVFKPVPPYCRRIILATNIAETSLTLPEVEYVVDSGRSWVNAHDPVTRRNESFMGWISRAEIAQRRGRAGRVRRGHYYAMYSELQFEQFEETALPQIHTDDLSQMILCEEVLSDSVWHNRDVELCQGHLSTSALEESIRPTKRLLLRTPSPVSEKVIQAYVQDLEHTGALARSSDTLRVSPLGSALSSLPLALAQGKAVLLGTLFRCMVPLLIMAVERQDTQLFSHPTEPDRVAVVRARFAGATRSDRLATVRGFNDYSRFLRKGDDHALVKQRDESCIRDRSFHEMAAALSQVLDILVRAGMTHPGLHNMNNGGFSVSDALIDQCPSNFGLVKALSLIICGSRLAVWRSSQLRAKDAVRVLLVGSVNTRKSKALEPLLKTEKAQGDLLAYESTIIYDNPQEGVMAVSTSEIPVLTAILFGQSISLENDDTIVIDGWLRYILRCKDQTLPSPAKIVFELRKALDRWLEVSFSKLALHSNADNVGTFVPWTASFPPNGPLDKLFVDNISLIVEYAELQSTLKREHQAYKGPNTPSISDARKILQEKVEAIKREAGIGPDYLGFGQ